MRPSAIAARRKRVSLRAKLDQGHRTVFRFDGQCGSRAACRLAKPESLSLMNSVVQMIIGGRAERDPDYILAVFVISGDAVQRPILGLDRMPNVVASKNLDGSMRAPMLPRELVQELAPLLTRDLLRASLLDFFGC